MSPRRREVDAFTPSIIDRIAASISPEHRQSARTLLRMLPTAKGRRAVRDSFLSLIVGVGFSPRDILVLADAVQERTGVRLTTGGPQYEQSSLL